MIMDSRRRGGLGLAAAAALLGASAIPASAEVPLAKATVDAAKAKGLVGEQEDGFLGFVAKTVDAPTRAAVAEINAARAQLYRDAAARNGVTPEVAGVAAYTAIIQARLKPGEYYRSADGTWVRKPADVETAPGAEGRR